MENKTYIKLLVALACLIIPSLLTGFTHRGNIISFFNSSLYLLLIYVLTITGIILFFVFKFHKTIFWTLLLGIAISPASTAVIEYIEIQRLPSELQNFGLPYVIQILAFYFYVIPFILFTVSIFLVLKYKESKIKK